MPIPGHSARIVTIIRLISRQPRVSIVISTPETDQAHQGITGYSYNDPVCLACHPTGTVDNVFDHNTTTFSAHGRT
jgi:hypothetical protein